MVEDAVILTKFCETNAGCTSASNGSSPEKEGILDGLSDLHEDLNTLEHDASPVILPFSLILATMKQEVYTHPENASQSMAAMSHNAMFASDESAKDQRFLPVKPAVRCSEIFDIPEISIHSRYILKQTLGSGTWSTVLLAVDRQSNIERAVKKIPKRYISELNRFRHEVQCHKHFDHPNIVRLYETFEDSCNIYMVLEYCKGGELFDKLQHVGRFGERTAAHLVYQILSSLAYCHSHWIAHRDLKLENLLFVEENVQSTVKLIDFGLSKHFGRRRDQKMHSRVGTLYYTSPQVLAGCYDHLQCDMWAAGVLLYMLLSGRPPFEGRNDAELISRIRYGPLSFDGNEWKSISPVCKNLISLLLNRNVTDRLSAKAALQHPWFKMVLHLHLPNAPFLFMGCASVLPLHVYAMAESSVAAPLLQEPAEIFHQKNGSHSLVQNYYPATTSVFNEEWHPLCYCDISKVMKEDIECGLSTCLRSTPFAEDAEKREILWSPAHIHISKKLIILFETEEASLYPFVPILEKILQKWMEFMKFSHLKKAILSLIAYEVEEATDGMKCLSNLFLFLDQDHDGFLSELNLWQSLERLYSFKLLSRFAIAHQNRDAYRGPVALTDLLSNPIYTSTKLEFKTKMKSLVDILSVLHVKGDSALLDFAEFLAASVPAHMLDLERACRVSFRTIDLNGDGQIDIDELMKAFNRNMPALQQLHQMKNDSLVSKRKCCFNFETDYNRSYFIMRNCFLPLSVHGSVLA
ncbi:hypothetical protein IE077_000215 [Cardiosporidium cionae]|uniref:Non-specific serine/threonine protein kinase n=1 Tax=Cardiosporidium cionae TaxID=476202 RepID=A0ABQ7J507_9APIC|nr:hypothetical protein IE077_000215 [Cardiosporidium cionae]|eukprot:KAF8819077.1 hypothetical protein IE077_000215 [Cardiosporidium cionae]